MEIRGRSREAPHEVMRLELVVMYLETTDEPGSTTAAWQDLEATLGSLRGRHFYGTFAAGRYRASVELVANDDPAALGLEMGVIPGGRYLCLRLSGEPPDMYECIPAAFESLENAAERDDTRPGIEFYRSRNQVDILMPIKLG